MLQGTLLYLLADTYYYDVVVYVAYRLSRDISIVTDDGVHNMASMDDIICPSIVCATLRVLLNSPPLNKMATTLANIFKCIFFHEKIYLSIKIFH